MSKSFMNYWEKTLRRVVDQSDTLLPSAWVSKRAEEKLGVEACGGVLVSGRNRLLAQEVISMIDAAKDKVVLVSFLFADRDIEDALLRAFGRGVRVYVLIASEARLGREEPDGEFDKRVLDEHKSMLNRLAGYVLFRSAAHFHAKAVVIDPEHSPQGVLLTCNLTKEALERNEEMAVKLTASEVMGVTSYLKWAMWESAEHELLEPGRFKTVKALGVVAHPDTGGPVMATTSKVNTIREVMLRQIDQASRKIVVCSYGWEEAQEVVRHLCAKAKQGVSVTVLARVRPAAMPALAALANAGARVLGFQWLHAKAMWTDTGSSMVMSANLERHGLDKGFELGVLMHDARAQGVHDQLMRWADEAQWIFQEGPSIGDSVGQVKFWRRGRLEEGRVEASIDVDLGLVVAHSADQLDAPMPELKGGDGYPVPARQVACTWHVCPPVLAANARERKKLVKDSDKGNNKDKGKDKEKAQGKDKGQKEVAYDLPVYEEPGGRLVVVVEESGQLELARKVMREVGASAIVVDGQ